jgi:hypothetical protein
MSSNERGGLKAAFTNFNRPDTDKAAELKLLGRVIEDEQPREQAEQQRSSYQVATSPPTSELGGLNPRPLLQREAVRQLSFRCPVSIAGDLKRKAAFNQLEQQEIIVEGIKRVLMELPAPPLGWEG